MHSEQSRRWEWRDAGYDYVCDSGQRDFRIVASWNLAQSRWNGLYATFVAPSVPRLVALNFVAASRRKLSYLPRIGSGNLPDVFLEPRSIKCIQSDSHDRSSRGQSARARQCAPRKLGLIITFDFPRRLNILLKSRIRGLFQARTCSVAFLNRFLPAFSLYNVQLAAREVVIFAERSGVTAPLQSISRSFQGEKLHGFYARLLISLARSVSRTWNLLFKQIVGACSSPRRADATSRWFTFRVLRSAFQRRQLISDLFATKRNDAVRIISDYWARTDARISELCSRDR